MSKQQLSEPNPVAVRAAWCKGCLICTEFCPRAVLTLDEQGVVRVTDPDACTGCRLCEMLCPDFAIMVRKGVKVGRKAGKTDAGERGVR